MSMTDVMAEGKFVRLVKEDHWEYAQRVNSRGVVVVIPLRDDQTVIMTEQYRPPVKKNVIEFPAGLAGDVPGNEEELFDIAAERELLEETGYQAGEISFLFQGPSSAGLTDEMVHFYLASHIQKKHKGGGIDGEEIIVHEIPLKEIRDWLREKESEGMLVDPKVYGALYFLEKP